MFFLSLPSFVHEILVEFNRQKSKAFVNCVRFKIFFKTLNVIIDLFYCRIINDSFQVNFIRFSFDMAKYLCLFLKYYGKKNENGISTTKRRWTELNFFSHSGNPLLFACVLAILILQCIATESFRLIFDSLKSKHIEDKWSPGRKYDLLRCSLAIKINCQVARIVPKMASKNVTHKIIK